MCPTVTAHRPLLQMACSVDQQSSVRQTCLRAVAALYIALATASLSMAPIVSSNDAKTNAEGPDLLMEALSDVVGPLRTHRLHASDSGDIARNASIHRRCKGYLSW